MKTILRSATLLLFVAFSCQAQVIKDTTILVPIYNIEVTMAVVNNIPAMYADAPTQVCALTLIEDDHVHMVFEYSRIEVDVLFHEVLHAVNFISLARGLEHDPENDEAQAYLAGYLGDALIKFFIQ